MKAVAPRPIAPSPKGDRNAYGLAHAHVQVYDTGKDLAAAAGQVEAAKHPACWIHHHHDRHHRARSTQAVNRRTGELMRDEMWDCLGDSPAANTGVFEGTSTGRPLCSTMLLGSPRHPPMLGEVLIFASRGIL